MAGWKFIVREHRPGVHVPIEECMYTYHCSHSRLPLVFCMNILWRTCPCTRPILYHVFYVPHNHTHMNILMPRFFVTIWTRSEQLPEVITQTISRFTQPYRFSLPCAPDVAQAFLMALPEVRYHEKLPDRRCGLASGGRARTLSCGLRSRMRLESTNQRRPTET